MVRLEFEIKLEPLLLYSSAATAAPSAIPPPALFKIRLVLQTPNLVHAMGGSIQALLTKKLAQLEIVPALHGLT